MIKNKDDLSHSPTTRVRELMDGSQFCVGLLYLEEISISERGTQTEDEVPLWMFWYGLHDGTVDDDKMLGCGFDVATLSGIARIEQ